MLGAQEKLDDLLPQKNWAKFGGEIFDRKLVDKLYKSFPCKQVQGWASFLPLKIHLATISRYSLNGRFWFYNSYVYRGETLCVFHTVYLFNFGRFRANSFTFFFTTIRLILPSLLVIIFSLQRRVLTKKNNITKLYED